VTHVSAQDPAHRRSGDPAPDPALRDKILAALDRIDWKALDQPRQLDLLRVYQVVLNRFGRPDDATVARLIQRLDPYYPAKSHELNAELAQVLVYLQAPSAAAKTVALLERGATQEEQLEYARSLRVLEAGWTPELRRAYFSWFPKTATFKGGNSFPGFMNTIRRDALSHLSEAEKKQFKPLMDARPTAVTPSAAVPERTFVKKWTLDELVPIVEPGLKGRDYDRGRTMFAAAKCFSCHRYNNEGGGSGPDLSGIAGRFSIRDLLESIVVPSKTISDQYQAVVIATNSGQVVTGRIVNLHGENLSICPDMLNPGHMVNVRRDEIDEMKPSTVSLMPEGLLDTLHRDEVLDLVAYLLSRGDRNDAMFKEVGVPAAAR
jgi:putative heme-binding domain-containing protein